MEQYRPIHKTKNYMRIKLITLIFLTSQICFSQDIVEFFTNADAVFNSYVKNGKVNYKKIKANPAKLDQAIASAKDITVKSSNPATYKAFWINAYNLAVIKGIVDNYPVKSPMDIAGFFDKKEYDLGRKKVTLNTIENEYLRAKFPDEARFHFVLVCAGLGCPPIIDKAYTPQDLKMQLEEQTKLALNNPEFIKVNSTNVELSEIFKWYKEDFDRQGGALAFINRYRADKLPSSTEFSYYSYNWDLNENK